MRPIVARVSVVLAPILLVALTAQGQTNATVRLRILGTSPACRPLALSEAPYVSHYFPETQDYLPGTRIPRSARSWYRNIYPGIDMACYGDEYELEYVFLFSPGSDISLVRLALDEILALRMSHTGSIHAQFRGGELLQSRPILFSTAGGKKTSVEARYRISTDDTITMGVSGDADDPASRLNNTRFVLVPAGGQPGGPTHDFYLSRYEVSNAQFLRFLNDTESSASVHAVAVVDASGNVWFNPARTSGQHEVFRVADARITYDPSKPAGARYDHRRTSEGTAPDAASPIAGVSWYGAVMYCNWLTRTAGRGVAEQCYTEGTNATDWAPVSATNWPNRTFGPDERYVLLARKGFRLPMVSEDGTAVSTNAYNELGKANFHYGYPRSGVDPISLDPTPPGVTAPPEPGTRAFQGFRVVTTYLPSESMTAHILYSFFMASPAAAGAYSGEVAAVTEVVAQPEAATGKGISIDVSAPQRTSDGVTPSGLTYHPTTPTTPAATVPTTPTTYPRATQPVVTLAFTPTSIYLGDTSTLTASPYGGSGTYVRYEYQYDNHYIWDPGWRSSSITGMVYTFAWDHYICYRVRVQDSNGIWSPWSNLAYLMVLNVPTNYPGPHASTSGQL